MTAETENPARDGSPGGDPPPRPVVLHYHLFKNAGTSVDAILERGLGRKPEAREFASATNHGDVAQWIASLPDAVAFTSHSANLPLPDVADTLVLPIVFVRHPLDRIRSAYEFERRQESDTFGAALARVTDFAGYVRGRLEKRGDRQCRDFHVARLARMLPASAGSEYERARQAVDRLPFVGLVEAFDESARRMEHWLRAHFPHFFARVERRNASTREGNEIGGRLAAIEAELGPDLHRELVEANLGDLALHAHVARGYGSTTNPTQAGSGVR